MESVFELKKVLALLTSINFPGQGGDVTVGAGLPTLPCFARIPETISYPTSRMNINEYAFFPLNGFPDGRQIKVMPAEMVKCKH